MINTEVYWWITYGWTIIAILLIPLLLVVKAPFGRHTSSKFGPLFDNKWGWIIMESPALWWFSLLVLTGPFGQETPNMILFILWMLHYTHRVLIYPFRTRTAGKKIPMLIIAFAFIFQLFNGFLNGYFLGWLAEFPEDWASRSTTLIGFGLFAIGMFINLHSDTILLNLRKPGETGYKIPKGGLFRYVSCPNFFGEILEWTGWAMMAWALPPYTFAIWTAANLIPRAIDHHNWYKEKFHDYPKSRKAVT